MAEQGWAGEGVGGEECSQKAGYIQGRRWLLAQGGGLSAGGPLALSSPCLRLEKRGRGLVDCHK